MKKTSDFKIADSVVHPGEVKDVHLQVSQRYTGDCVTMPVRVMRGKEPGPALFVCGTVHGDELNGMGIVRELMFEQALQLEKGTLILVPVVNVLGFESGDRYMPDRRDLNRFFPGSPSGNLSARLANTFFNEIVKRSDYGIDLHSAAAPRTNFPNIRCDLKAPTVRPLAKAFGCELMINGKGPDGSLRREATKAGCPTLCLEAGEAGKIEPGILEIGIRGVRNILKQLDMIAGEVVRPAYQVRVDRTTWVRAEAGGILRFHVAPGDLVEEGQPIATNTSVFGQEQNVTYSPLDGIILGMTTLPTIQPGEPICHVAVPGKSLRSIRSALERASVRSLHHRLRDDLATNISVSEHEGDWIDEHAGDQD